MIFPVIVQKESRQKLCRNLTLFLSLMEESVLGTLFIYHGSQTGYLNPLITDRVEGPPTNGKINRAPHESHAE